MHKVIILSLEYPIRNDFISGNFVKDHTLMLRKFGYDVTVFYNFFQSIKKLNLTSLINFFFSRKFFNKKSEHYFSFLINPYFDKIKLLFDYYVTKKKIIKYIKKKGTPDFILCHFSFPHSVTAQKISKEFKIPYVIVEHSTGYFTNMFSKKQLFLIKKSMIDASVVFCVSNHLKKKIYKIFNIKNLLTLGNVVDIKNFYPRKKKKFKIKKFLVVCQLVKKKRILNLLRVFHKLYKKNYDFQLLIVGEGPEESLLKKFVVKNKLGNKIFFRKFHNKKKLSILYNKVDFLLSCSFVETFGLTIAEALASELPVIVINSGGPKDFLNKKNSILVKNFYELEKALINGIKNNIKFNNKYLRESIASKFRDEIIFKKFNATINKLLPI